MGTPVSSASPLTHTSVTRFTPFAPWSCTSARGGTSAGLTSSPSLRAPTRAWPTLVTTSPSSLLESLVPERPKTPRRSFPTSPPSAPLARGRRERPPLRTRSSRPTPSLRPGVYFEIRLFFHLPFGPVHLDHRPTCLTSSSVLLP